MLLTDLFIFYQAYQNFVFKRIYYLFVNIFYFFKPLFCKLLLTNTFIIGKVSRHVVVDFRWSDPEAKKKMFGNKDAPLLMDEFGRLLPVTERWPSAAGGKGFKPVADQQAAFRGQVE